MTNETNPWGRYAVNAVIYITARDEDDAQNALNRVQLELNMLDLGPRMACVFAEPDSSPELVAEDAIIPADAA